MSTLLAIAATVVTWLVLLAFAVLLWWLLDVAIAWWKRPPLACMECGTWLSLASRWKYSWKVGHGKPVAVSTGLHKLCAEYVEARADEALRARRVTIDGEAA